MNNIIIWGNYEILKYAITPWIYSITAHLSSSVLPWSCYMQKMRHMITRLLSLLLLFRRWNPYFNGRSKFLYEKNLFKINVIGFRIMKKNSMSIMFIYHHLWMAPNSIFFGKISPNRVDRCAIKLRCHWKADHTL